MKNLKKLMSVILTVAMLMSFAVSTSAATFADVDETSTAYEAVEVLAALGILTGKDEGNFDPEANIKRSEFAAVICRAMNSEAAASGSYADFNDVSADHWAAGYIGWAAGAGIVNGVGNGNFDPDANVTYQQAVTMIVRAMGFEVLAAKRGGFPTGYMSIANTYGITSGVAMTPATGAASRAGVAQLIYNAFDAPLMDTSVITLSDDEEYAIYAGKEYANGSYDERRTLLSQYHDIYKIKATVENTYRSDSSLIKSNGDKQIELLAKSNGLYKFPSYQVMEALGVTYSQATGTANFKALCNDTTVAAYLGYTVNAYVTYNDDGMLEVLALVPDTKSIDTLEFATPKTDIYSVSVDSNNNVTFQYWENDKLKPAKLTTADKVDVYVNGQSAGKLNAYASLSDLYDGTYSSVTLLGSKSEGTYTKVLATQYAYALVEGVNVEDMTIETDKGDYTLNPDDLRDEFTYDIWKDGVAIELSDIAEGDLLNIVSDDASDFTYAFFADIYVTNATVESSVGEVGTASDGVTAQYVIDGTDYLLANGAAISSLKAGDTGVFTLTIDGYLYDADLSKAASGNYAFVLDMGLDSSTFGATWQIKMLTKDNSVVTLDVKDNVKIDGTTYKNDTCNGTSACTCPQCAQLTTLKGAVATPNPATANNRLITYKSNGSEITEINFAQSTSSTRVFNYGSISGAYNANTERLSGYNLLSGTVVFNAPFGGTGTNSDPYTLNNDKVQVYTISSLDEDVASYTGFAYDIDDDRAIGAALITNNMGFSGKANAMAVVKSVSSGLDASGNSADIINFFQAGEMKSLPVANDAYIGAYTASNLSAGDIFQYTTNAAGEINDMDMVFDIEETDAQNNTVAYNGGSLKKVNDGTTITYNVGIVTDISTKFVDFSFKETRSTVGATSLGWDLDSDATNVLFDVTKAKSNISNAFAAKSGTGYIKKASMNSTGNYTSDVYVIVAKADDGVITEVVTYKYGKDETRVAATFNNLFVH